LATQHRSPASVEAGEQRTNTHGGGVAAALQETSLSVKDLSVKSFSVKDLSVKNPNAENFNVKKSQCEPSQCEFRSKTCTAPFSHIFKDTPPVKRRVGLSAGQQTKKYSVYNLSSFNSQQRHQNAYLHRPVLERNIKHTSSRKTRRRNRNIHTKIKRFVSWRENRKTNRRLWRQWKHLRKRWGKWLQPHR
jgi:hypothetical protein